MGAEPGENDGPLWDFDGDEPIIDQLRRVTRQAQAHAEKAAVSWKSPQQAERAEAVISQIPRLTRAAAMAGKDTVPVMLIDMHCEFDADGNGEAITIVEKWCKDHKLGTMQASIPEVDGDSVGRNQRWLVVYW